MGYHKKRRKLATRRTAACQGPYQKPHVCALALVWAAFLGACENFSKKQSRGFKRNATGVSFSKSQCKILHLKSITEEGSGTDGGAQRVCPQSILADGG